jgi:isoquinoline 1-oxidoreductase alpha subunit
LLRFNRHPVAADVNAAMRGNICRCGTYPRIRRAIDIAASRLQERKPDL